MPIHHLISKNNENLTALSLRMGDVNSMPVRPLKIQWRYLVDKTELERERGWGEVKGSVKL